MSAEFDHYARAYSDLLRDPIRDRFARSAGFFHERKWTLLREFLEDAHTRRHDYADDLQDES